MTVSQFEFRRYANALLRDEQNQTKPDRAAAVRIALVYPNKYEVGIANLGFQEAYRVFNETEDFCCERAFVYDPPYENIARTLETQRELSEFDIIAFSISFELDYINLVQILRNAKLPLLAKERGENIPLVIAGGVTTFLNPAALAPIIDVFLLGEAEAIIPEFCHKILNHFQTSIRSDVCLNDLAELGFCYIPRVIRPDKKIHRHIIPAKAAQPACSTIITPRSHFQNMFCVEVGRACGRGCRFCAAGHVYRPIRFHPRESLLSAIKNNPFNAKKIGLIGAALSDHPELEQICESLIDAGYELGLSSFRMDMITPKFLTLLEKANIRTITLAPEAGSERLREIIGKDLSDMQIFETIESLKKSEISIIKLYFMIGLPYETLRDIEAIVEMVKKIARIFASQRRERQINISINAFIPKAFTPFQWYPMELESNLKRKRNYLDSQFRKLKGITVFQKSVRSEILQAIFSAGGSEIGYALIQKISSQFNWKKIRKESGIKPEKIIHRHKQFNEELPWDFIIGGVAKEWLWREALRARDLSACVKK